MGVLSFIVIDQDAAVLVDGSEIDILFTQKIQKDLLPDDTEISGKDSIIIGNRTSEV